MNHIIVCLPDTDQVWSLNIHNTAVFQLTIDVDGWHLGARTRTDINLWRISRFNDTQHLGDSPYQMDR